MHLIIDTTKDKSLVALIDYEDNFFTTKRETLKMTHSKFLLSRIEGLLLKNKKNKKQIFGIVCVTGPGSYTGSRVGVATTNALAYALDIPIFPLQKYDLVGQLLSDFKGLLAVPSYREHYLVFDTENESLQMVAEGILSKTMRDIILIDEETARRHDLDFTYIPFDYQTKERVKSWANVDIKKFKKKDITPFYFKNPKITKSKK